MSSVNCIRSEFRSSNGKDTVAYYIYTPIASGDIKPKGIIQLSHGMCEYVRRYEHMAEYFCSKGYIFCGNDHLGHGATAADTDSLGFTSEGGGVDHIVNDLHTMTEIIKKAYPGIPVVLFGHSMGSFMARIYITRYGKELAGAIICGTGGPDQPSKLAKLMANSAIKCHGEHYRSEFINNLAFGSYNKRYGKNAPSAAWLSRDAAVIDAYMKDPFCTFTFTARGFYDLFDALSRVSSRKWAYSVPKTLPIFLVSGDCDPVGSYGNGVVKVYRRLKNAGIRELDFKLYRGARHELQNEIPETRQRFFADILAHLDRWCAKNK